MNAWSFFIPAVLFSSLLSSQPLVADSGGNDQAVPETPATSIAVEISNDPELLVNSIFRNNSCFETENHTYLGFYGQWGTIQEDISQLGTFTNGMDATGIEQGIIMSTGRVNRAEGPNTFTGTTHVFATTSSDPDLIQLAGTNQLFDVSVVEFDFTPTSDFINFDYVFASEEYCEAVNNNNVDVFAFLISGPGINGPFSNNAENIAVLPDGSPVNVNTVNHLPGNFNNLYRSNVPASFNESCQNTPPVAPNDIEYDGMTTILTASSTVIPCETYHLKMIIADVGDTFYDSAVLLAAGSFAAGLVNVSEPGVTSENGGMANAPLEGCSDGFLVFSRLDSSNISNDLTIYFNISPTGSATFGVDYIMPTDSFIIEAGQFSDTLFIDIFGDDLVEGTENIVLRLEGTCNCAANTTEFFIVDPPMMTLDLADPDTLCGGSVGSLIPMVNGGVGDYQFDWSTGSTDSILNVIYTPGDSNYVLTVTDNCNQTLVDTITLSAPNISAELSGNYSFCPGSSVSIPVVVSGADQYTLTVSEDGNLVNYSGGPDTIFLTYGQGFNNLALVDIVDENGCPGIVNGNATVSVSQFNVVANLCHISCFGTNSGSIGVDVNGSPSSFNYNWGHTSVDSNFIGNLAAGTYNLTITNSVGCTFDTGFTLSQPAAALITQLDSISGQTCTEGGHIAVNAVGGSPNYIYEWQDDNSSNPVRNNLDAGVYTLVVSDQNGCTDTTTYTILDTRPAITATIAGQYDLCDATSLVVPVVLSGETNYTITINENGTPETYSGGPDTIFLTYTSATDLELLSVSANGCTGTVSGTAQVTQANFGLVALIDSVNCFGTNSGSINLELHGDDSDFTYQWADPSLSGDENINLLAGTYQVTITDTNGCQLDTFISVGQPSAVLDLDSLSSMAQSCAALATAELSPSGGTPPYSFDWGDGGADDLNRIDLTGGQTYVVTLTDSRGCNTTLSVTPEDNRRSLDASIGSSITQLSCAFPSIRLGAATNTSPIEYQWRNEDGQLIGTADSVDVSQAGTYQLIVSDPTNGCTDTSFINISQSDDLLVLDTGGPYVLTCSDPSLRLEVTATNFNGSITYEWRNAAGNILGTNSTLDNITTVGSYTIIATRVDNGCITSAAVLVTEDKTPPFVQLVANDISCNESLATSVVQNPNPNYTFSWSTPDGNIISPTNQAEILADRAGRYALIVTNITNGCTLDTFVDIAEDFRFLQPDAGPDRLLDCSGNGGSIIGAANPNLPDARYRWLDSLGNELSDTLEFTPPSAGVYILEVTHPESGCVRNDTINIAQDGLGEVQLRLTQPPCAEIGGAVRIESIAGGNPPFAYTLNDLPVVPGANDTINGLEEGTYVLEITDARGCSAQESFQLFSPGFFSGLTEPVSIRLGEDALLGFRTTRDDEIRDIRWQAPLDLSCVNCPAPLAFQPLNSFTALVSLVDSAGCQLQLSQQVFVDRADLVYAPTAFSPYRPDGVNDKFTLYGDDRFLTNIDYLRVFNRWGSLIWEGTDLSPGNESQGWDGYFQGKALGGDIFVFVAQVTYFDGQQEIIKGEINIVR